MREILEQLGVQKIQTQQVVSDERLILLGGGHMTAHPKKTWTLPNKDYISELNASMKL